MIEHPCPPFTLVRYAPIGAASKFEVDAVKSKALAFLDPATGGLFESNLTGSGYGRHATSSYRWSSGSRARDRLRVGARAGTHRVVQGNSARSGFRTW